MKHAASESDVTLATSPPRAAYYVQSPSRDSQSSATSRATPVYNNTPLESPSTGRHSRVSSSAATRYSAFLRSSSSPRKRGKEWREVDDAIDEEEEELLPKVCVAAFWLSALVLVFAVVCLIVWAAALNYEPGVIVKSLTVHNLHVGEGADGTGVPTKLVTLNCTLHIDVRNPSTMSGIHVSSSSSRLMYSEIPVANGQLDEFYQPRRSRRVAAMVLHGDKTPLYGAGATLDLSSAVPLTLELAVATKGYVIGRLVTVSHAKHVECPVVVVESGGGSRPVRFRQSACSYAA